MFYKYLRKQKYNGRTGRITFDDSGDRLFSEYDIVNIYNSSEHSVGKYSFNSNDMKMKLNLFLHLVKWPGNSTQKPLGYNVPKHLRVTTLAEKPFVWANPQLPDKKCASNQIFCPKYNSTSMEYDHYCCQGYCIDLLKELAKRLNFTYEVELVADGQYGSHEFVDGPNMPKQWTGLVGELVNKRTDMVVAPLTANPER